MTSRRSLPRQVPARRVLPIREALEWAFATELARIDFADDKANRARPEVSTVWTMMRRGALGTKIDGGGYSPPAADADTIAATVARLPLHLGGRGMALRIAELARAGQAEDWGADLRTQCIPVAWKGENQQGPQAATELVGYERIEVRGRVREFEVRCCPVTFTATASRVASARAGWTAWRDALAWLAEALAAPGVLDRLTIAPGLPEVQPWKV